jgi:hypothetical protein
MTELEELEVEANEALFNMGRLAERLGGDDGRRLVMLASTLMKYKRQLETRVEQLEGNLGEPNND